MRLIVESAAETLDRSAHTDVYLVDPFAVTHVTPQDLVASLAAVAPVLVVMWSAPSELGAALLRAGAQDVIDRRASPEMLLMALRRAVRGSESVASPWLSDADAQEEQAVDLSRREEQVLQLISRGMTHHQAATALGISPHTVDTYVKRIRAKLGLGNKAELARVATLRSMVATANPSARQG
jgi:DNA-binding NarL/FixJ family response regulator